MHELDICGIILLQTIYIYFNDVMSKNTFWNIHIKMTSGKIYNSHKKFSLILYISIS